MGSIKCLFPGIHSMIGARKGWWWGAGRDEEEDRVMKQKMQAILDCCFSAAASECVP